MAFFRSFDISSDFTLFYLGATILMIVLVTLATKVTSKPGQRGRIKHDDSIINRDRELID